MDKFRQQELLKWLKQQSIISRRWLNLSRLTGVISGLLIVAHATILAWILHGLIMDNRSRESLWLAFSLLLVLVLLRALLIWLREKAGFYAGQHIRREIRRQVLDRLHQAGPAWIQGKPTGSWATLILEQIDDMQDYYARYLPQMTLAGVIPLLVVVVIFPVNWAASLILLLTAPLIPIFMALVGLGAADANRRNFQALARLSGHFLDRLRGMETLRLFHRGTAETEDIRQASQDFRKRTMDVLWLAFLSSGVLEFFASLSIALVAAYFGFSYLGEFHFGGYGTPVTLFAGFLALILAPEFFQPLRDLGTFYHAKAQAIGAADNLKNFLDAPLQYPQRGSKVFPSTEKVALQAEELIILSPDGKTLAGPMTFSVAAGQRVALVGQSGCGKTSLLNVLAGFLPYQGSLRVNGIELHQLEPDSWRRQLSWISQSPQLPGATLRENVLLSAPDSDEQRLQQVLDHAWVSEFLSLLPEGIDSATGEQALGLSVGQAQRLALARALLSPCGLLLLDEPAASLDAYSEQRVMQALEQASRQQTTFIVTHQLDYIRQWHTIWLMYDGRIIEQGDYATLAANNGPFADLIHWRQQEI